MKGGFLEINLDLVFREYFFNNEIIRKMSPMNTERVMMKEFVGLNNIRDDLWDEALNNFEEDDYEMTDEEWRESIAETDRRIEEQNERERRREEERQREIEELRIINLEYDREREKEYDLIIAEMDRVENEKYARGGSLLFGMLRMMIDIVIP